MIKLITDSVASIPADLVERYNMDVVSMYLNRDGVEYDDATMDLDAFYEEIQSMVDNIPTSAQPTQLMFEEAFERAASQGNDVMGMFISSAMSGTVDTAVRAANAVKGRYPNTKFAIVDSFSTGGDEGMAVLEAAKAVAAGKSLQECAEAGADGVSRSRYLFAPDSLTFLRAGGRIGTAAALVGNVLKLIPILTVVDGMTYVTQKVRTHKKAIRAMFEIFKNDVDTCGLRDVFVQYIGPREPAVEYAHDVVEPFVGRAVRVMPVSSVVGLHVGPTVALSYVCDRPLKGKMTCSPSSLISYV